MPGSPIVITVAEVNPVSAGNPTPCIQDRSHTIARNIHLLPPHRPVKAIDDSRDAVIQGGAAGGLIRTTVLKDPARRIRSGIHADRPPVFDLAVGCIQGPDNDVGAIAHYPGDRFYRHPGGFRYARYFKIILIPHPLAHRLQAKLPGFEYPLGVLSPESGPVEIPFQKAAAPAQY